MKREFIVLAATAAFGAGAFAIAEEAEDLNGMSRTGEVVDCVNLRNVQDIDAVTDSKLIVEVGLNEYYVTETSDSCSGATHPNTRIVRVRTGNRMCKNDIVQVVDNLSGAMRGSCSLGAFERLSKAPA
jgi:hypothetical protein